jgi:hypothetical protein
MNIREFEGKLKITLNICSFGAVVFILSSGLIINIEVSHKTDVSGQIIYLFIYWNIQLNTSICYAFTQVTIKHVKGGKELKMDLLVMENLLFGRNITRLYDLKGSSRSRYNADSSGSNKVLLDQNLLEAMPTSPIFVGNKAKRLLERAVWNDTSFLAVSLPLLWTVVDIIN